MRRKRTPKSLIFLHIQYDYRKETYSDDVSSFGIYLSTLRSVTMRTRVRNVVGCSLRVSYN